MTSNQVINLLDGSKEERQRFLNSFDLVLTDCDGTVWHLTDGMIEGAGAGCQALKDKGKRIIYTSNNAVRSEDQYLRKFEKSGIKASFEDVLHPGIALIDYLKQINFDGLIYMIGSPNLKQIIENAGYEVFEMPKEIIEDNIPSLQTAVFDKRLVSAVIIDWDFNLSLKQLIKAHIYLRNPDCEFLVCATDMVLPLELDISIIGPGPFYKMIEQFTGRKGTVVGKPGLPLRDIVMKKYNVTDPSRVLFIGDSLESDVGFGNMCGFQTLAVLTGTSTRDMIATHPDKNLVPNYVLPSFADFVAICGDLSN